MRSILGRKFHATKSKASIFKKSIAEISDPFEPLRILEKILTPEGELSEKSHP